MKKRVFPVVWSKTENGYSKATFKIEVESNIVPYENKELLVRFLEDKLLNYAFAILERDSWKLNGLTIYPDAPQNILLLNVEEFRLIKNLKRR